MPQPVVHFEIIGKDPSHLRKYFSELFDWEFDIPSPVVEEVSGADRATRATLCLRCRARCRGSLEARRRTEARASWDR